jgi:predicted molibdopterin-dependent oxidoreductase YjgC
VIRRHRPEVVLSINFRDSWGGPSWNHPDHRAVSRWTTDAWLAAGDDRGFVRIWDTATGKRLGEPLEHPGTATVHAGGFLRGKGRLMAIPYRASPEQSVEGFPYTLVTGRVLQHYNVGTMTRRTPNRRLVSSDVLEIHPEDALREGLGEGAELTVESRWGRVRTTAHLSRRVAPGTLFLSFHFPESHTNRLTGPHVDPDSNCPQYKVTAVRVREVG